MSTAAEASLLPVNPEAPAQIDEFMSIFFRLVPTPFHLPFPIQDRSPTNLLKTQGFIHDQTLAPTSHAATTADETRLAAIFTHWLTLSPDAPNAYTAGQNLGHHVLSRALDKGASAASLLSAFEELTQFYLDLAQDLEEAERTAGNEGGKDEWPDRVKAVLGEEELGRGDARWKNLVGTAQKMFALMRGAEMDVRRNIEEAARFGIFD